VDLTETERRNGAGLFITFEGGEGVGKSTQIALLADRLRGRDFPVIVSREPGGTAGAEAVRHVLLDHAAIESFGPAMEAILFAASRNDHVEQVIRPALRDGAIVLVDRFIDSTRVYQGMSGNLDTDFIAALERVAVHGVMPDMTVILDLDPTLGLARAAERREQGAIEDRFEKEKLSVHRARRVAFQAIAAAEPNRCRLIDADGDADEVAMRVWQEVQPLIEMIDRPEQHGDGADTRVSQNA